MSKPSSAQPSQIPGPPYPPHFASIGGEPSVIPDVPPLAIFIAIYLTFFVSNIGRFNFNRRKGHFFFPSALLGGFSMARVLTCSLRIGWATNQHNISLGIAATMFVNAGILIVYIINVIFAQRILRAKQPKIGWSPILKIFFIAVYCLIFVALVLVITLGVMSFFTLDPATLNDARWIQRSAILYLFLVTLLPIVLIGLAFSLPRAENEQPFGEGSLTSKAIILAVGSCVCILISGFKVGVNWSDPQPISNPAWYDSKAAFYVFNFTLEIILLTFYTGIRVDKRFYVPKGSHKRRTYEVPEDSEDTDNAEESDIEKKRDSGVEQ